MRGIIAVTRHYRNREGEGRRLDPNFLNAMTVLAPQRRVDSFPADRRWVVFSSDTSSVVRTVHFSRQFHKDEDRLCIDYGFAHALRVDDDEKVSFRKAEWYDYLRVRLWFRSLTPALRIVFWLTVLGVLASSFIGAVLGVLVSGLIE